MIKYACDFSQSESEKCFEWIIMSDSSHFQDENLLLPSWSFLMTGQNWVLKRLLSTLGTLIRLITRPSYYFINVCRSQVCKIVLDTSFDRNNENMPGLFKHLQHAGNIALIRLEFTKCSWKQVLGSKTTSDYHKRWTNIHILLITHPIIGSIDSCWIWIWIYSHTKIIWNCLWGRSWRKQMDHCLTNVSINRMCRSITIF